ncbi:MAG TPA: hypothetical protein VIE69_08360 [Methylophilaceae bacterium]|jgi:hypothetical protein
MSSTSPVFSSFLTPEVLAAASVTRMAFLDDSPVTNKPVVSSIIDISARARALATADTTTPVQAPASATPVTATQPTAAATETVTATAPPVAATPPHINPPPTVIDGFTDAATFAAAQANSFATAQAVAAYYLINGFGKESLNTDTSLSYLPPSTLVSPVNPVARIAALHT